MIHQDYKKFQRLNLRKFILKRSERYRNIIARLSLSASNISEIKCRGGIVD